MDKPVRAHIEWLEMRLRVLTDQHIKSNDKEERNSLEIDIRAIHMALALYRSAMEIEKGLEQNK